MHIVRKGNAIEKLTQMGDVTLFEPAGDTPQQEKTTGSRYQSHSLADCISNVQTPRGKKPVLKTMITTACERNCFYCPFRAGHSKTKRVTITPDALAGAFDKLERAKQVDGLFLSSGIIKGGATSQDKIIDTADILRKKYDYRGYIHLKIMPGAEHDQLKRAMQLADRVSINLEAPTTARLQALAPKKNLHDELLIQLQRAHQIKQQNPEIRSSIVTQFVVGAVGDTDLELLSLSQQLYQHSSLTRAYYSAFSPVDGTPLENTPATDKLRQHRLYQASFLLRDYAWDVEELPFINAGNLRTDVDPKLAWADLHLRHTPIDLMHAPREQLIRVPGIGMKLADAILKARRIHRLADTGQLTKLGLRNVAQLSPYVLLDGRRPPQQKMLF
ncbi:MAG: radical SAM protein [Aggregatilineales bacterium]